MNYLTIKISYESKDTDCLEVDLHLSGSNFSLNLMT